jgi:hypothetical protein
VPGLLSGVAEERPLVCVVDDLHWQDRASAQTSGFVARRLLTEPIAFVFAVDDDDKGQEVAGLPELLVRELSPGDAGTLLDSLLPG